MHKLTELKEVSKRTLLPLGGSVFQNKGIATHSVGCLELLGLFRRASLEVSVPRAQSKGEAGGQIT